MPAVRNSTARDGRVEYNPRISDLPEGDRPRERLIRGGAQTLSNAELLAILLRVGVAGENVIRLAERLLSKYKGLAGLARADLADLIQEHGMGEAKASQLKAALEIGRRLLIEAPDDKPQVRSPADAANLLMLEMSALDQEQLRVVLLDTRNRVQAIREVYRGSLNTSVIRVSEIFRDAIRQNCAGIIVVHNHPSGDPSPSPEDIAVTRQIVQAGKLLDIDVLDHLVIGQQRYVSLKERGLGF